MVGDDAEHAVVAADEGTGGVALPHPAHDVADRRPWCHDDGGSREGADLLDGGLGELLGGERRGAVAHGSGEEAQAAATSQQRQEGVGGDAVGEHVLGGAYVEPGRQVAHERGKADQVARPDDVDDAAGVDQLDVAGAHHVREAVVGLAGAQDPRALVEELDLGGVDDGVEHVVGRPLERREPPQEAGDLVHRLLLRGFRPGSA